MNIDAKDKQLLALLSTDARAPYTQIGKRCRLHKDTAAYRIKQLEQSGVITGYTMFYDFSKMGMRVHKIYLKFRGIRKNRQEQLREYIKESPQIGWFVEGNGAWDVIIGAHTKDNRTFYDLKLEIEHEFHDIISYMTSTSHVQAYFYPRAFLSETDTEEVTAFSYEKPQAIDEEDLLIMHELVRDARQSAVDIAECTGLTARVVSYRIQQLQKRGIILQYRASLNLEKIDYVFVKAFITLRNTTYRQRTHILEYLRKQQNVVHNVECLGDWDLEPEFEVASMGQFYMIIDELRTTFPDNVERIESMVISQEYKYQYVPKRQLRTRQK